MILRRGAPGGPGVVDEDVDVAQALLEQGQIEREEVDGNGDGRPDAISLYVNGQISEKREDIDFDGKPDVVSRYKNGKLASREADSSEVFELWNKDGAN